MIYIKCSDEERKVQGGLAHLPSSYFSRRPWDKVPPMFTSKTMCVFKRENVICQILLLKGMSFTLVGGKWDQRPAGRLPHRSLRGHTSLEDGRRPLSHTHPEAHRSPPAGDQCGPATVSSGAQHLGLPQHQQKRGGGGEAALGIPQLRPRARLSQLGPSERHGGQWEGVSHVQDCGPLRAPVAGLRGGLLRRCRTAHSCVHPMWARVLREVCKILVSDPAASRNSRLSCRLPFLCHAAAWGTELHQIDFPRSGWLTPPWQPSTTLLTSYCEGFATNSRFYPFVMPFI